ncbi:MarR family protein [Stackebrandtia albiflava]|uniref:MarR family protein n=1 Tax=Stackebrandtia albiflava TaxID=406432 RepID=A0A562V9C2_9ACTN|nr:MarR family winged helix-turn-helix transcriptional regulator [Stackebrandtia albiflava]TWJ14495.1 MarR family protein [Stackebrandtia albiflava]
MAHEDSGRLAEADLRAWQALRQMSRHLDAQLARELAETGDLSMQDYDVLSAVAPAEGRRLPAKRLMLHLQWSYSRLSHHLGRMEKRRLVTRCPSDTGKGVDVVATVTGYQALRAATGAHLRAVRRLFADRLLPGDAAVIEALGDRVLSGLPGPTPTRGW